MCSRSVFDIVATKMCDSFKGVKEMHKEVFVYKGSARDVREELQKVTSEEFERMKKRDVEEMNEQLSERSRNSIHNLFKRAEDEIRRIEDAPKVEKMLAEAGLEGDNASPPFVAEQKAQAEQMTQAPPQPQVSARKFGMEFFREGFYTTTSLVVSSIKGGVGKSSSAVSIAGAYSEMFPDNRVLLIDCDPQGNASTALGCVEGDKGLYEMFTGGARISSVMKKTAISNIFVVPGDPRLMQYQMRLMLGYQANPRINFVLRDSIEQFKRENKGNWFIIYDTRPDLGIYTLNAYIAADALICPITPCEFALDGFSLVFDTVDFVNRYNPNLKVLGVFRSKWEKVNSVNTRKAEEEISKYGSLTLQTSIPNQTAIPNSIRERVPVNYSKGNKHSSVAKAYKALLQEILDRWNRLDRLAGVMPQVREG